jgi:hypothetical protein
MLWVVLVTTVVTILRFTITLQQQYSALGGFYSVVALYNTSFHSFANSACYCIRGGTHPWVNPSS